MDTNNNTNDRSYEPGRGRSRSNGSTGEGVASRAATKAIHTEGDVKQAAGPAVSNTYVAEKMEVTNNYNF